MFHVPENVYFVAACNPYQLKSISEENQNDIVRVHPSKQNLLSHKVLPISPNLLYKIFDYGALDGEIEHKYIQNIFLAFDKNSKKKKSKNNSLIPLICDFVYQGQNTMKRIFNNPSAVSLRDINRVKEVFIFYIQFLQFKDMFNLSNSETFEEYTRLNQFDFNKISEKNFIIALTVTMFINYIFRLGLESKFKSPINL
jgi:hypothetical protein